MKEILKGARILTLAVNEKDTFRDIQKINLKAKLSVSKKFYILNGKKEFVPNIEISDYLLVLGRTDAGATMFIVDRNTYGIYWE